MASSNTAHPNPETDDDRNSDAHNSIGSGRATGNQNHNAAGFTFAQVANHLNVAPDTLRRLTRRFDRHLGDGIYAQDSHFSGADVAALVTVQQLLSQGYDDAQIHQQLTPTAAADLPSDPSLSQISGQSPSQPPGQSARTALSTIVDNDQVPAHLGQTSGQSGLPKAINDVLDTLVGGQKAVLNSQASVREMLGVVAQDNFNLKEENRKLRERMLELERAHGEYLRRDEARRERMENRIHALEATVGALQQQVAQLVQAFRRPPPKRRGWFG
ncbi:MAG: hypothetical protein WDZ49_10125 [Litorilinea sp.]